MWYCIARKGTRVSEHFPKGEYDAEILILGDAVSPSYTVTQSHMGNLAIPDFRIQTRLRTLDRQR